MTDEEMLAAFANNLTSQLRTMGVELYNDVGDRIRPNSSEEQRIVRTLVRGLIQCQTDVRGSAS